MTAARRPPSSCPRCGAELTATEKGLVHCTGTTCTWGLDSEHPIYVQKEQR